MRAGSELKTGIARQVQIICRYMTAIYVQTKRHFPISGKSRLLRCWGWPAMADLRGLGWLLRDRLFLPPTDFGRLHP